MIMQFPGLNTHKKGANRGVCQLKKVNYKHNYNIC